MIKYSYTILYVEDVDKTMTFYSSAFGFQKKFITPEADYGELSTGETTISFASHTLASSNLNSGYLKSNPKNRPFGIELGFVVEDVQKTLDIALRHGAILIEPVNQKPWGQEIAYISDINGFLIELCTPVSQE
ncbi:MAG: VOC family protein [Flavobacteriales bacterium]|nr:VOC family protein [Flavobacteriales bacterium]